MAAPTAAAGAAGSFSTRVSRADWLRIFTGTGSYFCLRPGKISVSVADPGSGVFLPLDPGSGVFLTLDPVFFLPLDPGSGVFLPLDPGSGMGKNPEPGSGFGIWDEHPSGFWIKNTQFTNPQIGKTTIYFHSDTTSTSILFVIFYFFSSLYSQTGLI